MIAYLPETESEVMVRELPAEESEGPELTPACLLDVRQPIECKISGMARLTAES